MKAVVKSLAASVFATGLASFFLLTAFQAAGSVMSRRAAPGQDIVVFDPSALMRQIGLPLAAVMFVVFFALALRRFRRPSQEQPAATSGS